ncbi:diaminohydroxyphosphoribosylaminopyrimidine deaminase [Clostridium cavendishii DSM 21758]|uniref:Riboflavin biosynthesis protein RibD n=1 Tax=Clostridium cavendishii DSM 21758 TaxID=1121302 RepID=A0A1M6NJY1_9CLOT|nr:bifunctional diaminohydroxyphosphoribosylaminopyrimidine deaminase/5-amino-6-(5-phosphoribosylamino)uracil reductase RibD [Clostridium cavendishii]SHJ95966.1 diaminohydroxyphosphoribosylaminopyrimidine deaminase [Clostridium cavendishii DSM 21758]
MDEAYMKIALELAEKGRGKVNPNPMVGAIIVKDERIIAKGYHEGYGKKHAEINAFNNAIEDVSGATMYVTLEPCIHYGKTPPCVDMIIKKQISKVVIGMIDPNKLVSGKGAKKLKDAGIEVLTGVLEEECKKLNEIFVKFITTKIPFLVLKTAMSLDGKIATSTGESKWITDTIARNEVHSLRGQLSGIMVGVNTIIKDNPKLTCRIKGYKNPIRIVVDSTLRIPVESNVIQKINNTHTIIVTTKIANISKIELLRSLGVKVLIIKEKDRRVDLKALLLELGKLNIDSILLEGGATLNYSALEEGIVDKVQFYLSPKIIGGEKSKTPVGGKGIDLLKNSYKVKNLTTKFIGEDILIEGYINKEGV